jgi:hypothetical protein
VELKRCIGDTSKPPGVSPCARARARFTVGWPATGDFPGGRRDLVDASRRASLDTVNTDRGTQSVHMGTADRKGLREALNCELMLALGSPTVERNELFISRIETPTPFRKGQLRRTIQSVPLRHKRSAGDSGIPVQNQLSGNAAPSRTSDSLGR